MMMRMRMRMIKIRSKNPKIQVQINRNLRILKVIQKKNLTMSLYMFISKKFKENQWMIHII